MTLDRLRLRVQALLHNPPDTALTRREGERLKDLAVPYLQQLLDLPAGEIDATVRIADHIASGADEYNFPKSLHWFTVSFREEPTLRHPLSGSVVALPTLAHVDPEALREAVSGAIARIKETYGGEPNEAQRLERYALLLWRELPDLLAQDRTSTLPPELWAVLPAEARIPDHAIWEHLGLTAALASAGIEDGHERSTAALLLFTLGPVQRFINAARKTSDLWAGSYMLSYLAWQAIKTVCQACGPEAVLFPDLRRQPLVDRWLESEKGLTLSAPEGNLGAATLPNRFFAVVPEAEADDLARTAARAVRDEVRRICQYAQQRIGGDASIWTEQARHFFECYWAVLPIHRFKPANDEPFTDAFKQTYPEDFFSWDDPDADAIVNTFHRHQHNTNVGAVYGRLYRITDALVGSRKALRDFEALDEPGYRCSLIPSLAAVVPRQEARPGEVRDFWHDVAERIGQHRPGKIRENERLSAVAAAKRFFIDYLQAEHEDLRGKLNTRFPSTASMAAADFKADVIKLIRQPTDRTQPVREALKQFRLTLYAMGDAVIAEQPLPRLKALAGDDELCRWLARLDGEWLFDESFEETRLEREYPGLDPAIIGTVAPRSRQLLGALLGATDEADLDRPSKYYAVLMLDGDHMGRWLSGQMAPPFCDVLHPQVEQRLRAGTGLPWHADWGALLDRDKPIKRPQAPSQHLAISRALGAFALRLTPQAVETRHLGRLIYSGGDDVLAFVSFDHALSLARMLRAAFSGHLDDDGGVNWNQTTGYVAHEGAWLPTMGHTASASAGVVFAHFSQSLQQVLEQGRKAEHYAKDHLCRDALALCVMKRSGETFTTGARWRSDDGAIDLVEVLGRYAELVKKKLIATRLVYELEAEKAGLRAFVSADAEAPLHDAVLHEARRLFERHAERLRAGPGDEQEALDAFPDWLRDKVKTRPREGWTAALRREAFEGTLGALLRHAGLEHAVSLLDAAQFIGLGGAR